ncbi:MAG: DsbA family protein [Gallionella sp.]|nr:DsbA family protein [Gallionella sp.]
MQVKIWPDAICPWCHIGKRRFETALMNIAQRDNGRVIWRSFEPAPMP